MNCYYVIKITTQDEKLFKGYLAPYSTYDTPVYTTDKTKADTFNLSQAQALHFLYTNDFHYAEILRIWDTY